MATYLLDGFELEKTQKSFLRRYPGALGIPVNLTEAEGRLGGSCLRADSSYVIPITNLPTVDSGWFSCGLGLYISALNEPQQFTLLKVFTVGSIETLELIVKRPNGIGNGYRLEVRRHQAGVDYRVDLDLPYNLEFNGWYFLEMQANLVIGDTALKFKINGDTEADIEITDSNVWPGFNKAELRLTPGTGGFIQIDDFYIGDDTLGFLGPNAQISGLYPNADGPSLQWTAFGGLEGHFDAVDDAAVGGVDDDVSYLRGSSSGNKELLNYTAQYNLDGPIKAVELAFDGTTDTAADEVVETLINDTVVQTPTLLAGGYQRYATILNTDPVTLRPWDLDDLESILCGFKIPGDQTGSENLYAPLTLETGSPAKIWLNDSDILVIKDQFGVAKYIASANNELDLIDEFGNTDKIPLLRDTEGVEIGWGLYQARFSPAAVESDVPKYRKCHYTEGDDDLFIDIEFVNPAQSGTFVAYTMTGDAQEGVDFIIESGASPIAVAAGATKAQVHISFPNQSKWFRERQVYFNLDQSGSSKITINQYTDQFRVFIRSTKNPPIAITDGINGSGGVGTHNIGLQLYLAGVGYDPTQETSSIYWKVVGGDAQEGVDYQFVDSQGIDIVPPANTGNLRIQVLPGATPGRYVEILLDHEKSDLTEENLHCSTENWGLEEPDGATEIWPGDPGDNVGGGVEYDDKLSLVQVVTVYDPIETIPDGQGGTAPLPVHRLRDGYDDSPKNAYGYTRKSLEDKVYCDGSAEYHRIYRFNYFGMRVRDHRYPGLNKSEFVSFSLRDRGVDIVNKVLRNSDLPHGEGDHNCIAWFQRTGADTWVLYDLQSTGGGKDWYTDRGVMPTSGGVEVDPDTGDPILWVMRTEYNPVRLAVAGNNILLRPINHPTQGSHLHLLDATALYGGMFIHSQSTITTSPPPRYWPKLRNWHEPFGNVLADPGRVYTFTIT